MHECSPLLPGQQGDFTSLSAPATGQRSKLWYILLIDASGPSVILNNRKR